MQGTILVLDGVSTNRIMLKVQLTAAWYQVAQGDRVEGLLPLLRRVRPDLVLTAMTLKDGSALDVKARMLQDATLADIPVVAIASENDRTARLRALSAGLDDVLTHPYDDVLLLARIRSLIRTYADSEELRVQSAHQPMGFAEPKAALIAPAPSASVALVTRTVEAGAVWQARLKSRTRARLNLHRLDNVHTLMHDSAPDAIVIEMNATGPEPKLLADLRARSSTRHAAVIAVNSTCDPAVAADALDRGADDVMPSGFCAEELGLRLNTQLARKIRSDHYRTSVRDGLQAALTDTMTGLRNRRFALPELQRIATTARERAEGFAVMIVDLDNFKQINDTYGHLVGDAVLIETAQRLRAVLAPDDLLARLGGEEFLIALPGTCRDDALRIANRLCRRIGSRAIALPGQRDPIAVTASIGLLVRTPERVGHMPPAPGVEDLIEQADRALYVAKGAGRNRVSVHLNPPEPDYLCL